MHRPQSPRAAQQSKIQKSIPDDSTTIADQVRRSTHERLVVKFSAIIKLGDFISIIYIQSHSLSDPVLLEDLNSIHAIPMQLRSVSKKWQA